MLPEMHRSIATEYFIAVGNSWARPVETDLVNIGFWVLWLGVGYLLFIWRKADHLPPGAR
jgi:hypothetical protein